jgi:uncharacterized membrane protein (UPF0127 family)
LPRKLNVRLVSMLTIMVVLLVVAGVTSNKNKKELLAMGSQTFTYEIAKTTNQRQDGLSGRPDMAKDHAMIFVFQQQGNYCFWMKEMHFPLDIVWLDSSKHVVHIEQNLSSDTYPKQYCPNKPALYTIEVNAGVAAKTGVRVGDSVSF